MGVLEEVKTGSDVVMSGSSKISDIAKEVWEFPVNFINIRSNM